MKGDLLLLENVFVNKFSFDVELIESKFKVGVNNGFGKMFVRPCLLF
jgi:hypothetical protein